MSIAHWAGPQAPTRLLTSLIQPPKPGCRDKTFQEVLFFFFKNPTYS